MKLRNFSKFYIVDVSREDIVEFMKGWPASGLQKLQDVSFTFAKPSNDLIGVLHSSDKEALDAGEALRALADDAVEFARCALPGAVTKAAAEWMRNERVNYDDYFDLASDCASALKLWGDDAIPEWLIELAVTLKADKET